MSGYSETPLAKKLGIKAGDTIFTLGAPNDYRGWLSPLPENVSIIAKAKPGSCAIVHLFAPMMADIERNLPTARRAMTQNGALWGVVVQKIGEAPNRCHRGSPPRAAVKN